MKQRFCLARYAAAGMLIALSTMMLGCKRETTNALAAEEEPSLGAQYSAKGLLIPDDTRQSLGVKTVEVSESKVTAELGLELRVYQTGNVIRASALVTPEQGKSLKTGQSIQGKTKAGSAIAGEVVSVNDQMAKASGLVEVLVEISSPTEGVTPGTFLQASVTLESDENVMTIPRAALLRNSEGHFVYAVSGEHMIRTAVKVGGENGEVVEITDGLYTGDQVVLQPVMSLWMTELAAVKGGQACCIAPPKGK